jgi:hypothetical protein
MKEDNTGWYDFACALSDIPSADNCSLEREHLLVSV